jgi:hypothetical protein
MYKSLVCLLLAAEVAADSPRLNVVPYPAEAVLGADSAQLDSRFSIDVAECHADCDVLRRAAERYSKIIFHPVGSTGTVFRQTIFEDRINASTPQGFGHPLRQLRVVTTGKESVDLQLGVDESYVLNVPGSSDSDEVWQCPSVVCTSLGHLFNIILFICIFHSMWPH